LRVAPFIFVSGYIGIVPVNNVLKHYTMEKTIDLKKPGMVELGKKELQQTNGGWMRLVFFHLATLATEALYEGTGKCLKDFKEGFDEGYKN
jgi:hypothetical protein